ncbi:caspase family protein [Arthrobacter mobilis]|uniref:Peptidase C14 caspase domain-containing protein n=1 Tax=Arthrobacter mobilis TaxID=2724944 RepID=A0A7X6HAA0_9MICC|nr:caspase family protein [Arthrobacter mobilis]NKX53341.1 hypothetical protein [Arthrobacter mobilis]
MADYAVVVGIARYPRFALQELQGPDRDAQDIYGWLVDPDGGGVPPENVKLIRQADLGPLTPDNPEPDMSRVHNALLWIGEQTREVKGDRLYLYFSGHGFAPVLEEGALFTAEASSMLPAYVYAFDWLRGFRQALRFREYVLWMDCCMTYQQSITISEPALRLGTANGVPGPMFVGVAAQTKSALEHPMADGQVHGVFSWTLLQGLRGAAANDRGQVTGESLKSFLHNAMPEFLPESVRSASAVDLHPFIRTDEGITFTRLPERPTFRTVLTFPEAAAGKEFLLWTGRPHIPAVAGTLGSATWTGALVRGLYVAEVPALGLRHGFQVSGAGEVAEQIRDTGPPVRPADPFALHRIEVTADNPAASILVTDYALRLVFSDTGSLRERDMPGVYKIRTEFGRDVSSMREHVVLLDGDLDNHPAPAPPLASPATLPEDAGLPRGAGPERGRFADLGADRAAISVLARYVPADVAGGLVSGWQPLAGLELIDSAGTVFARLADSGPRPAPAGLGPESVWEQEVGPGTYYLRGTLPDGRTLEATVPACPGYVTSIALERAAGPVPGLESEDTAPVRDAAVFLRKAGSGPLPARDEQVIEAARIGLAQGRNPLYRNRGSELQRLLLQDYDDPIAGIIGAHLLLRAAKAANGMRPEDAAVFDAAVVRLRSALGTGQSDVEALSLCCADPQLRRQQPVTVPPLFEASWRLLAEYSYANPELVPLGLWQRVQAAASEGPYFVWATDEPTRKAHLGQLRQWLKRSSRKLAQNQPPDKIRREAMNLALPASALAALWQERTKAPPRP